LYRIKHNAFCARWSQLLVFLNLITLTSLHQKMFELVYCSKASHSLTMDDIYAILDTANQFNEAHNITGEEVSTNILANRLKRLEEVDIIAKATNPNNKPLKDYTSTLRGYSMAPIFKEISVWTDVNIGNLKDVEFPS
jgi:DNA-binding HxlR family transcriptional regulator